MTGQVPRREKGIWCGWVSRAYDCDVRAINFVYQREDAGVLSLNELHAVDMSLVTKHIAGAKYEEYACVTDDGLPIYNDSTTLPPRVALLKAGRYRVLGINGGGLKGDMLCNVTVDDGGVAQVAPAETPMSVWQASEVDGLFQLSE